MSIPNIRDVLTISNKKGDCRDRKKETTEIDP